ncbi:MAG: hypothetical protein ACR2QM_14280 [Longimicrobiales bacterium]
MRFAYMDDKGRQVHVSSFEDLGNHIESGAVDDDTELYDALEDRWGPAREHPTYVSVRDQLSGQEPSDAPSHGDADFSALAPDLSPAPHSKESATSDDEAALERDWSSALKDEFLGAVPGVPAPPTGPAMPTGPAEPTGSAEPTGEPPKHPEADLFRTGEKHVAEPEVPPDGEMETLDGSEGVFESFELASDAPVVAEGDSAGTLVEPPLTDAAHSEGIQFEDFMPKPQSGPAAAPPDLRDDSEVLQPVSDDDGDDFLLIDDLSMADEAPAPKKSKSRRRTSANIGPAVRAVAGLALLVLVVAVALPRIVRLSSSLLESQATPTDAEVTVAAVELPEHLRTEAYFLASRAQESAFAALDSIRHTLGVDRAPPSDWMEGVYLAHGSRYPAAQSYWERYRSYLSYARRELPGLFEASFRSQVDGSGISQEAKDDVLEVILSEFNGRYAAMGSTFDDLSGLADAALELHAFLVLKEDEIEYAPFTRSGVSRDPIVEAVPKTDQTRADLWDRLGRVTDRLEALDALEAVTTERLQVVLLTRLQQDGF